MRVPSRSSNETDTEENDSQEGVPGGIPHVWAPRFVVMPVGMALIRSCRCNDVRNCGCRTYSGAELLDANGEFVPSSNGITASLLQHPRMVFKRLSVQPLQFSFHF